MVYHDIWGNLINAFTFSAILGGQKTGVWNHNPHEGLGYLHLPILPSESEMYGSRKSSGGSVNGNANYDAYDNGYNRKPSNELTAAEIQQRRLSEAGLSNRP